MTRSVAVTIILSLTIGCALSQLDMISEPMITGENDIGTSTMEACYDSGWTTKCECPESSPNACGHTLTTICDGVEKRVNTENLTRAECYVPGEWSEWAEWNTCNTTCPVTGGWRNRTRECDSATMKQWQNAECNGTDVEWQECACGGWAAWTEWSACQVTCDGGIQTRERTCEARATVPSGAGLVCEGEPAEEQECGLDECPLDAEEEADGVYIGLITSMTVIQYYDIRQLLQNATITMINNWCYKTAYDTCCPGMAKQTFPRGYQPWYVDSLSAQLKGAFTDDVRKILYIFFRIKPDIAICELCNGIASAGRKKRQAGSSLSGSITSSVASAPAFTSAVTKAAAAAGFNVTVTAPLNASAASSLKASLATTVANANATTVRATVAPAPLGMIVGFSVGGGLILIAVILIIVVVVKKKMAKTGIAEITASGDESAGHQHEHRHRELEDGNVAYPAPQYPARGAVAPVSQS